jgi:glycosyltransferase involved in cell wall biosynthesis
MFLDPRAGPEVNAANSVNPAEPILRVCARPGRTADNPFHTLLHAELRKLRIAVEPYSRREIPDQRFDILHVHWPDVWLNFPSAVRCMVRLMRQFRHFRKIKNGGAKIVWTVHNLGTHEGRHPLIEAWFWKRFVPMVDAAIVLTEVSIALAQKAFPHLSSKRCFVVPHGHYRDAYPMGPGRAASRRHFGYGESATVLCFLGLIRPYKNVPELIARFRALRDPNLRLLVGGVPRGAVLEAEIRKAAGGEPRIQLHLRRLDDVEIPLFLQAADLVVLPFKDILNSGSAILGLSYSRPLLVPEKGSMPELKKVGGEAFVRTYPGEFDANVLADGIAWAKGPRPADLDLSGLEWDRIARQTLEVYCAVLGRPSA